MKKLVTIATAIALAPLASMARERSGDGQFDRLNEQNRLSAAANTVTGGAADVMALLAKVKFSDELKTTIENLQSEAKSIRGKLDDLNIERQIVADKEEKVIATTTLELNGETSTQVDTREVKTMAKNELDARKQILERDLKAVETKITNLRAIPLMKQVDLGLRVIRKGTTALILVDAASRAYIYTAQHRDPTFSPVLTYMIDKGIEITDKMAQQQQ